MIPRILLISIVFAAMTTIVSGLRYRGKKENQDHTQTEVIEKDKNESHTESIDEFSDKFSAISLEENQEKSQKESIDESNNNLSDDDSSNDSDDDSDKESENKSSQKESVGSYTDPVKLAVKEYNDNREKVYLRETVIKAIGDFDMIAADRDKIYHFTQKKIGFKKVVCVKNNMDPIIELLALVLIPDSVDIIESKYPDYEGQVEADVVFVHSLFVPHNPDIEILNKVFVRNLPQYQIPGNFYSKYSCVTGTGDMSRYYPSALIKKSFIRGITFALDLNDALKVKIMDDIDKLSTPDLKKREIGTAMFMLDLQSMINDSDEDEDEKMALKNLVTQTKGNLLAIVNHLNEMKVGRDAMETMIIEDALNGQTF
ncbi:hypothetical protein H012_gp033 [Acanthamoeba polyphaga moumouvirus]|uniref:Uncharacterized protein n=1 Tax=Acanthamoeba polyphaga moumouvirus TaxID=1269028 RepID=L7RGY8_9VIRU|nr:hypothetical protein H012_gp033 [Acanthamoeba polyphaga moumouvirus]AGC02415.1 hypothetical protein Moumou_00900 [Acanthamoeba polyphaga moumouvirus]